MQNVEVAKFELGMINNGGERAEPLSFAGDGGLHLIACTKETVRKCGQELGDYPVILLRSIRFR